MLRRLENYSDTSINITINGEPATAREGDTVAAAVLAAGLRNTRTTAISGAPRAPFCLMGVCFECLMIIDGKANQRACMASVREGMSIEYQRGTGSTL